MRHCSADQRPGDIIEETRKEPYHCQQGETPLPPRGKKLRQHERDAALFEMTRQNRKTGEQTEQVRENDPLVREVRTEPGNTGAAFKSGEPYLVESDRSRATHRDGESATMEKGDAEQGQPEQNEIDRDTKDGH